MALSVVERPEPLRPSRLTISPGAMRQRDAVQDVALVVVGVQALDLEQGGHHAHLLAEIGFLHLLVGAHRRRLARGDDLAVDQHRDLVAEREHDAHVVLDDQQRAAFRDATDQVDDVGRLVARHAGRRLVEDQHRRIGGERHPHLEDALLGVGEVAGEVVAPPRQPELLEVLRPLRR